MEFYLKLVKQDNYSKRELDRQISASLFERKMIGNLKLSPAVRENNEDISKTFKDSYVFEFLNLRQINLSPTTWVSLTFIWKHWTGMLKSQMKIQV